MDKIVMQKCCCSLGCKLRSCAIVMSIINLISGGFVAFLLLSGMLPWVGDSVEMRYEDRFAVEISENQRLLLDSVRTIALYTDIILIILTIPLLVGVIRNIRELLLPWLIVFGSQLIAVSYFCIVFICDFPIFVVIIWILTVPIWTYEYLVVHSYYYSLAN